MDDIQLVADYFDSDCPDRIPEKLNEELKSRMEENYGKPITHLLKTFIDEYPESLIEAGSALAMLYHLKKDERKADEWMNKLVARYPHNVGISNLRVGVLFGREEFDAIEELIDLEKTYTEQFPQRKIVSVEEYFRYEIHGIRWLLVNQENPAAMTRARKLVEKISVFKDAHERAMEIFQLFEDYVPEEEYTDELTAFLDELVNSEADTQLPGLIYPELSVLFTPFLLEKDLPKVLALLKLPDLTLGSDLFVIVHDCLDPFKYQDFDSQVSGYQLMLSLIIMAGIDYEDLLEPWALVLEGNKDFLDFWLGDDLPDEMFYVGYVAGKQNPALLGHIFNFEKKTFEANFSILVSLAGIAWHVPEKRAEVLDIFEWRMKELLAIPFVEFTPLHRKILTEFIDQSSLLNTSRFAEIYRLAIEEDRIDLNRIDPDEIFSRKEGQFTKRFQYPLFLESLKDKITRIYSRNR